MTVTTEAGRQTTAIDTPVAARAMRVLLLGHGGYYNRGCEAIVRTTVQLLKRAFGNVHTILSTFDLPGDQAAGYALTDRMIPASAPRWSPAWALARLGDLRDHTRALRWWLAPLVDALPQVDLVLSIGGDNYCYGTPSYFIEFDRMVRQRGIPLVLWGASIDTSNADEATCRDLREFDLITARETITVEHLAKCGAQANVKLVADPAFTLTPSPCDCAAFWPQADRVLGFNISNLLTRYLGDGSLAQVVSASTAALRYLIDQRGLGIVLVPHVMLRTQGDEAWNDDRPVLEAICKNVDRPGAITLMPGHLDAGQIKYVISRCQFFIGARTHSTIAALSTQVPTLSIGYSIKAWGINQDIFDSTQYVLDCKGLDGDKLTAAAARLLDDETAMRTQLQQRIPRLIERAYEGGDHLVALMKSYQSKR